MDNAAFTTFAITNAVKSIPKAFRFIFRHAVNEIGESKIQSTLDQFPGISEVDISGQAVTVYYDLRRVTLAEIERALVEAGIVLPRGWIARAVRALCRYQERCELGNLQAPHQQGGCCNRPPPGA